LQRQWTRDARRGFVIFWDWETGETVRRIDVEASDVSFISSGTFVFIISVNSFYVLDHEAYKTELTFGVEIGDEGAEAAFEVVGEVSERYVSVYSLK